jgi:L-rhamnose mutarotase
MQRTAFVMTIQPGTETEYERRHRQVWAEMLAELRAAGAQSYSIFRQGTRLFAYLEVEDLTRYQRYLAGSTIAATWETYMSDILIREVDPATAFPPLLPEVFHLEKETAAS